MKSVSLINVSKSFGDKKILDNLSLFVEAGAFFVLLGPSGCGKTTLLRLIAGLELVDFGKILLADEDITQQPAYQRRVNTVFQQQGLFPHLTVFENIAYGLVVRGLGREEIKEKVERQIQIVNLLGLEKKYPATLSGGQRQRVALARSLIMEPDVLLFDEPMSALDARLKERMLIECLNLQHALKTTFIYITHDRKEALMVADEIAVMNFDGKVEQIGAPKNVYQSPRSRFVANFIGDVNIFAAVIKDLDDNIASLQADIGLLSATVDSSAVTWTLGARIFASVRPERLYLAYERMSGFGNVITGKVASMIFSGVFMRYTVLLPNGVVLLVFEDNFSFKQDDEIFVHFHNDDVIMLES
jgi:spermidine/putrescine transport system ATP-binding protein